MSTAIKIVSAITAVLCLSFSQIEGKQNGVENFNLSIHQTPDKNKQNVLALKPIGKVNDEVIQTIKEGIKSIYGWEVYVIDAEPAPLIAWYKPRKRFRAEKILLWLTGKKPSWAQKIMGVAEFDISTTKPPYKDWGICGYADIDGPASVVSTYRIKRKLGKISRGERKNKFLKRLYILAAHEFGHGLGLEHCPYRGCIMEDAGGTVLTFDHTSGKLCDQCRKKLSKKGIHLIAN